MTYWRMEYQALKSKETAVKLPTQQQSLTEIGPKQLQLASTPEILKSNVQKFQFPRGTFFLRLQGKYLTKNLHVISEPDERQGILWLYEDFFMKNLESYQVLDVCEYSPMKAMVQKKFKVILYQQKQSGNDNQKWNFKDDGVIESRIIGGFCLSFDNGQLLVAKDGNKRDKWQKEYLV